MPADATTQNTDQNQQTGQPTGTTTGQNVPASGQPTGQPTGQQTATDTSTQRPDAGNNSGQDDRTRGVIADLQKERRARQQLEQQLQQSHGELEAERRRIRALAGVDTPSPEEAEIEQVRARLIQVFPALAKLTDETLDRVLGLSERAESLDEVTQNHWTRHGQSMLDGLASQVSEAAGIELTDRQRKALFRAYVAEAESNPEFLQRHEQGDPRLLQEFAKQWVEDWIEPVRRNAVQQEASRFRRVPNGRDRNVQTQAPKKIDFKDAKAVEDAMVESFRANGGRFDS